MTLICGILRGLALRVALGAGLALVPPGLALAFERLEFNTPGADSELRAALERASLLSVARAEGLIDPLEVFAIARVEYGRLIGVLYEAARFSGTISVRLDGREAAEISPLTPPERIGTVQITVVAGPEFTFGSTRIGPLAPGSLPRAGFVPGAPARSTEIRDAAREAVEAWREFGHARAAPVDQDIVADHGARVLDVSVRLDPGPRLRFGALTPSGQDHVRAARVATIAGLPSGQVFSPREAQRSADRLRRTGTFASVTLREAHDPNPDGTLDFTVTVVEAPRRRIGAGAEFDTEDGARLSAFWLHRNLLGGAERFRLEGEIGGIGARSGGLDFRLGATYTRPATITADTALSITALLESEDERDFDARRARISAGLTHVFSDRLTAEAAIGYEFERARFGPSRAQRANFATLRLPFTLTWDLRDNALDATRGAYLAGTATPFVGLRDSDSGAQATLDARGFVDLDAQARLVLAGRAQAGAVLGADIARTPRGMLFTSGGGGTVRGQPFRALGVTVDGVRSGGRGFAAVSGEVRAGMSDSIGLVAFADAGRVSAGAFGGVADWHAGAGLGVRYATPVGPLRLDLGFPLRGATGRGAQVYIGIGQAF